MVFLNIHILRACYRVDRVPPAGMEANEGCTGGRRVSAQADRYERVIAHEYSNFIALTRFMDFFQRADRETRGGLVHEG